MRSDMSKVIVERPRRKPWSTGSYPRSHLKRVFARDLEAAPSIESMGGHYAEKDLNENLQPLVRFLRTNVGRPWRKVHSEIAAHICCRSAVQKHVLDHLRQYVQENVWLEGRTVMANSWRGWEPLESYGSWLRFYVCPRTGLLRLAPFASRKRRARSDPNRRQLSDTRELRRIDGIWYELSLASFHDVADPSSCFDVLERSAPKDDRAHSLWSSGRYVARKRQLNTRELAHHGLSNAS